MNEQPAWPWNEIRQIGTDYAASIEVERYEQTLREETVEHVAKEFSTLDSIRKDLLVRAGFAIQEIMDSQTPLIRYLCRAARLLALILLLLGIARPMVANELVLGLDLARCSGSRELPGGPDIRRLSVLCIRFHPSQPDTLYATTPSGLFRSRSGGDVWEAWGEGLDGYQITFLAIQHDEPEVMLLGYSHGPEKRGGVLKSTDGGAHWSPSLDGLPQVDQAWRLVAHPRDPRTFYLGWHRGSGLFVTRNAGTRWEPVNLNHKIRSAWFYVGETVTGLDIDPTNPDRLVYCNDMDLYQTLDGGAHWDQVATDCVRPATPDSPAAWRGRGCEVLCMTGPQALAVDPSNPSTLWFGYWDVHAWKSDDGGRSCYQLTNGVHSGYGRMGCVLLDPADPEVVWISVGANDGQHRLYKTVNGSKQFRVVGHEGSGLPPGGIFSLVLDPTSPIAQRVLYATVTGHGVYKSSDGGLSWKAGNQGLPADSRNPAQIALDPRNPLRLFLAGNAHYHRETRRRVPGYVARSDNGGRDWQIVKPRVEAQCVLIDPFDSRKIYVGNRNFSGIDYPQALYRSLDGGDTWTSIDQSCFLQGPGSLDGNRGPRVNLTCLAADLSLKKRGQAHILGNVVDIATYRSVML